MTEALLDIRDLRTEFGVGSEVVRAVRGVDLAVAQGETVAVVGESGSGKSVTGLSIMRLVRPPAGRIAGGTILFRDRAGIARALEQASEAEMQSLRGNEISMIFQEPMTSLNPTFNVGAQIAEAVRLHQRVGGRQAWARAVDMLRAVEIPDPAARAALYPHQLSGGMRQRVMIAMALACTPRLLIADEPTTALDVTVQAQILLLMRRLQRELGMGILFITHNLGVVAEIADRVAVMYGGRIVESAPVLDLFDNPRHPYTQGLLASLPPAGRPRTPGPGRRGRLRGIAGQVMDPRLPPPGCGFAPRCVRAQPACNAAVPPLTAVSAGHEVRCIRWMET